MCEQESLFSDEDAIAADKAARTRIDVALDETLFVEAGAGSGKTTKLVERVLALVDAGAAIESIAAITFTEKAAAELRDRVRFKLDEAARADTLDAATRGRYRAALDGLDGAAISTLHAFAQRILSEHPIEAGLPPRVEVLDEISSEVAFEQRFTAFLDQLLDDRDLWPLLTLAQGCGVNLTAHLRQIADVFNDNWDLVAERIDPDPPALGALDVSLLVEALEAVATRRSECSNGDDKLVAFIDARVVSMLENLEAADEDVELARLVHAAEPRFSPGAKGAKSDWDDKDSVIAQIRALDDVRDEVRTTTIDLVFGHLAAELARFTLESAEVRRLEGALEFHDLLVRARQLLRDAEHGAATRGHLRATYRYLLLDEFQDTDPIQVELALLIAAETASPKRWVELEPTPGSVFFVGDPKQSIYRFRRADIQIFLDAQRRFSDGNVALTRNFRTTTPIIEWINDVFGSLITYAEGSQPAYQALTPVRDAAPVGPAVTVFGTEHQGANADALRRHEAADVVATIRTAMADGWQVARKAPDETSIWENCTLGDITILLPSRTSLPSLEQALDDADIPYRAETSSLVYATREVRDLMALLRAVADPTDQLNLVATLRSPAFGCGDDDIWRHVTEHGGSLDHQRPVADDADGPVADALRYMAQLHDARFWTPPSEMVSRVIRDRRLLEFGFTNRRPRDLLRRLRFVVDQARAFTDAEGGGLRDFLSWVTLQSAETARVSESVLPETDDDSVRIMTIHASKGLEFPITILSGLSTKPVTGSRGVTVVFPPEGRVGISFGAGRTDRVFEQFAPIDETLSYHERLRLMYVAATRAQDHLVVSLHRKVPTKTPDALSQTIAELFAGAQAAERAIRLEPSSEAHRAVDAAETRHVIDKVAWQRELDDALSTSGRRRTVAATTLAKEASEERDPGLQKQPRDLDLPPWHKGRYGTAIGRAVHGTLQSIDLATGRDLAATAQAQAAAEGVIDRADIVESLSASALTTGHVGAAVASTFWREVYVGSPFGDTTLEGYVDLLYRGPDGLVVVDYKTDQVESDADLEAKIARYALQGASYALAVANAVGEPVVDMAFLFLSEHGAIERSLPDLTARVEEVRAQIS